MQTSFTKTTKGEQQIAKNSIFKIHLASKKVKKNKGRLAKIKLTEHGDFLEIPKKAVLLLVEILENMAEGKSFTLVPANAEIGTQQAAELLNMSRPHLVKLLEEGAIPFKKVGTHRRIEFKHLDKYRRKSEENKNNKLDFLTKQAQELDLGY